MNISVSTKNIFLGISAVLFMAVVIATALFTSAGRVFIEGIVLIVAFVGVVLSITIYLIVTNPYLYNGRMKREQRISQKVIQSFNLVSFISVYIVAGFSMRYEFWLMPIVSLISGLILFILSSVFTFKVIRENKFLFSNISVEQGQKVISTGLYSYIRHPMYSSAIIMMISFPLILRSALSFIPTAMLIIGVIFRIHDEEKFLNSNLKGYNDYLKKVKYKLIPYIF